MNADCVAALQSVCIPFINHSNFVSLGQQGSNRQSNHRHLSLDLSWHRLHVVPQPVDVDLFNPEGVKPLTLPQGQLVFGQPRTASRHVAFLSVRSECLI